MNQDPLFADIRAHVEGREREEGTIFNCGRRQFVAAVYIIRRALGNDWCDRNVFPQEAEGYLANRAGNLGEYKPQDRVVVLAELLLNLRRTRGIEHLGGKLQNDELETIVAQLEAARLLMSSGIPFQFVKETGVSGQDYDVLAVIGGVDVACEMKAKLEVTAPTAASVCNSLDQARGQLPKTLPGIVFLKVPEAWGHGTSNADALKDGIQLHFSRSQRITAVAIHSEQWRRLDEGALRVCTLQWFKNPKARHSLDSLETCFPPWHETLGNWVGLDRIVCEAGDVTKQFGLGLVISAQLALELGRLPPGALTGCFGRTDRLKLRAKPFGSIVTFQSRDFDPKGFEPGKVVDLVLAAGPIRELRLIRMDQPGQFQLCIPEHSPDPKVSDVAAALMSTIEECDKMNQDRKQGTVPVRDPDGNPPIIRLLRTTFEQLRSEGDIPACQCTLHHVVAQFGWLDGDKPEFGVVYAGRTYVV